MELVTYRIDREDAARLLFLFHGYSAEQHHLAAYVPLIDPHERFTAICPRAPHDLADSDGASWFHIGADGFDRTSFDESVTALRELVHAEADAAGVPLEQCVIGGFSQGGYLALALAGQRDRAGCAGVWAMCCGMPPFADPDFDPTPGRGCRALVQYGTRDPFVAPGDSVAAATALMSAGWDVRVEGYDMAHSQTLEMMADARDWLTAISQASERSLRTRSGQEPI